MSGSDATTTSHKIVDYMGQGLLANRPTPPPIAGTVTAFYLATDTGELASWFIDRWVTVVDFTGDTPIPPPAITDGFLLEDNSGLFVLEDNSGYLVQET